MTRKDYKLLAKVLRQAAHIAERGHVSAKYDLQTVYGMAEDIARALEVQNSKFNYEKFMEACGL